jgi:hypothetical protein
VSFLFLYYVLTENGFTQGFDKPYIFNYEKTNVFLICFAVNSKESLFNVSIKYISEIRQKAPKAKVILVVW